MTSKLGRYVVGICAAAILGGCGAGGVAPSSVSPATTTLATTSSQRSDVRPAYGVIYSFKSGSGDGEGPVASLVNVKSTLYGTTYGGGAGGEGAVFSITTSGKEAVLYSFYGGSDGANPLANLLNLKGKFYGTTCCGGLDGDGDVFSVTPSGTETVLHTFAGSPDGAGPRAGLINVNGTLYGTTNEGGANCTASEGCGTVFKITTSGKETVLHSFGAGSQDGTYPAASLVAVGGTLYGTTYYGGAQNDGTVFKITTTGAETVLHSFGVASGDGEEPAAGMIDVKGTLYGTTLYGGADYGTVFKITTSGKETVLHSFAGGSGDGSTPFAGLTNVSGTLYGTTYYGGANNDGTVIAITTSGVERLVYGFKGGSRDGAGPEAGLFNVNGTLYGVTDAGGKNNEGTVFSLSP